METIKIPHQVLIEPSPNDSDIAIVPINSDGNYGVLNESVLHSYGYDHRKLPDSQHLQYGFSAIPANEGKPIIFVVTIEGARRTKYLLKKNLYQALVEYREWFRKKKLWLPLLGTGTGKLSLQESFDITTEVLNRFFKEYHSDFFLVISLPNTSEGKRFRDKLTHAIAKEEAKEFVSKLNSRFYMGEFTMDDEIRSEEFFRENTWEITTENRFHTQTIFNINTNDIIILRSVTNDQFETPYSNKIQIRGVGLVVQKSSNGMSIKVDWKIKDIHLDIPGLDRYKDVIELIYPEDVALIFPYLNIAQWQSFLPTQSLSYSRDKIAGLISDSETGNDYLSIDKDVRAFARVIAAKSFEPPLAIALLGKWGSGKSFFMRKLKEQIEDFSGREANGMYCNGVVHIHFNAWSYMDANLWASFVSRIFEGLQQYVKNENSGEQKLNDIRGELTKNLNITKANITALEEKKEAITEQIKLLGQKRDHARDQINQKINQLRTQTVWSILQEVDIQFKANDRIKSELITNSSFLQSEDELRKIVPEQYWNNPESAYKQARSAHAFLKEFFSKRTFNANLKWLIGILLLILIMPIALRILELQIAIANFTIPQVVLSSLAMISLIWTQAETTYKKLHPVIASLWKIKMSYEQERENALAKFEQEEKALKLEIENGEEELLLFTEQIQKAELIATELDYKIANTLSSETLYSFIDDRSKSDDYKKHLGIISIIRKDFEILNELFLGHKNEILIKGTSEEFKKHFKKPVERIILYIDDLDRCPEENVVQVLEAVNLLMAFPLFVVIVGVDPRWVKNALIKKYTLQFTGGETSTNGIDKVEPSDYLEKIFQIPFCLKDAQPQSVKGMIRQLAGTNPIHKTDSTPLATQYRPQEIINEGVDIDSDKISERLEFNDSVEITEQFEMKIIEQIDFIELSENEIKALESMGEVIGSNPRAIKRFVNIFKIIKAHEDYTLKGNDSHEELLAVVFLLALSIGQFKYLMASFEDFINDPIKEGYDLSLYLRNDTDDSLRTKLDHILFANENYHIFQNLKAGIFKEHNTFIKRFTFKTL